MLVYYVGQGNNSPDTLSPIIAIHKTIIVLLSPIDHSFYVVAAAAAAATVVCSGLIILDIGLSVVGYKNYSDLASPPPPPLLGSVDEIRSLAIA